MGTSLSVKEASSIISAGFGPGFQKIEQGPVLQQQLLTAKCQGTCTAGAYRCSLDDFDDRRFVRKRWGRSFGSNPRSRSVEKAAHRPPVTYQSSSSTKGATVALRSCEGFERMARGDKARLCFSGAWSARERPHGRGQAHEVEPLAFEGVRCVRKPVSNRALGTALERDLDEPRVATMKAAQQMDGVGHIAAGMPAMSFEQGGKMQMACGSVAGDPGELGSGYADRYWFD